MEDREGRGKSVCRKERVVEREKGGAVRDGEQSGRESREDMKEGSHQQIMICSSLNSYIKENFDENAPFT